MSKETAKKFADPDLEPYTRIKARQEAARCWLNTYGEKLRSGQIVREALTTAEKALLVIVLTERTSDHLAHYDPQALKQAQIALDNTSWETYMLPRKS